MALRAELETFVEKHDYRRMDIEMGGERDSWRRALTMVSGDPVA